MLHRQALEIEACCIHIVCVFFELGFNLSMASKESIDSAVVLFQACFLCSLDTLPSPIFNMFNPSNISSNLSQQQERWFGYV